MDNGRKPPKVPCPEYRHSDRLELRYRFERREGHLKKGCGKSGSSSPERAQSRRARSTTLRGSG